MKKPSQEEIQAAYDALEGLSHMCRHGGPNDEEGAYFNKLVNTLYSFITSVDAS